MTTTNNTIKTLVINHSEWMKEGKIGPFTSAGHVWLACQAAAKNENVRNAQIRVENTTILTSHHNLTNDEYHLVMKLIAVNVPEELRTPALSSFIR